MNLFTFETQVNRGISLIGRKGAQGRRPKLEGLSPGLTPRGATPQHSPRGARRESPGVRRSASSPGRDATGKGEAGKREGSPYRESRNSPGRSWRPGGNSPRDASHGSSPVLGASAGLPGAQRPSFAFCQVDATAEPWLELKQEVAQEVTRILAFDKKSFSSILDWAFAVLGVMEKTLSAAQRSYRALMKKLHPDKTPQSPPVVSAVEMIQEAKSLCERCLCTQDPPGPPGKLSAVMLCATPGHRKYSLQWSAPAKTESAPVHRYIIAVADPTGQVVRACTLEPDYCEKTRRFVSVEELSSYTLSEQEIGKRVPNLFSSGQAHIMVLVAAANKVGQSPWAQIRLPLMHLPPTPPPVATVASLAWQASSPALTPRVNREPSSPALTPRVNRVIRFVSVR